jgi:hypothetical protein
MAKVLVIASRSAGPLYRFAGQQARRKPCFGDALTYNPGRCHDAKLLHVPFPS